MAYFDCIVGGSGKGNTLVVTCADDLAGATITCTNGTKTYTKTCPSTAPYEVTFYGLMAGTWTVSATVSGNTYTTTVVITDYEAELGGFNWKAWVDLSENYASSDFTDLDDLLSDETAIRELMTIHACVDYLAEIAAESADVETIIGNDLCAKWINNRDYALDTLYANEIIAGYMDTADKYFYGEWALMPQVPTMTSNTAPYGAAYTNAVYDNRPAYLAFDNNDSTYAAFANEVNNYLQYTFVNPINIKRVRVKIDGDTNNYKIQVSNDGFSSDVRDIATLENVASDSDLTVDIESDFGASTSARIVQMTKNTQSGGIAIYSLQFYAWAPKGNVPVMTSNTAPYGTAYITNQAINKEAYKAFDGNDSTETNVNNTYTTGQRLYYKFVNPVNVKKVAFKLTDTTYSEVIKVQYSDDGSTWNSVSTINMEANVSEKEDNISDNGYHLYWALYLDSADGGLWWGCHNLQFYGRSLSVSVPTMTSNTAPYGVASSSASGHGDNIPWWCFDNSDSTTWNAGLTTNAYIQYNFNSNTKVLMFAYKGYAAGNTVNAYSFGGVNNSTVTALKSGNFANSGDVQVLTVNNYNGSYKAFRLTCTSTYGGQNVNAKMVQFYGLDYSEKEFEEGTTKKWLYDHGVELEGVVTGYAGTGTTVEKSEHSITVKVGSTSTYTAVRTSNKIDVTNYSFERVKVFNVYTNGWNSNPPNIQICSGHTSDSVVSYGGITTSSIPNNSALGISSINGEYYCALSSGYNSYNMAEFTEWWLE